MKKNNNKLIAGVLLVAVASILIVFTLSKAYSPAGEIEAEIPLNNLTQEELADITQGDDSGNVSTDTTTTTTSEVGNTSQGQIGASSGANQGTYPPSRLVIPKLDIDAHVQHLGVTASGLMAAPKNMTDVSWFKLGTIPGEVGSAVMAGHEDNAVSIDGVFKNLEDLNVGDSVYVKNNDGSTLHFRVIRKSIHPYNLSGSELTNIFGRGGGRYLNLITCTGDWLPEAKTNDKRLVVYTELVN